MATGNLRIPNNVEEGVEITCPVCGTYSGNSDMANEYGDGFKIPLQVLEQSPYICAGCGTEYRAVNHKNHWHFKMGIPDAVIKQDALKNLQV